MEKNIVFISIFKDLIPKYIKYKRALGFKYEYDYLKRLRAMDRFIYKNFEISDVVLTKEMVLAYTKRRDNEANSTTCGRCSLIRGFATYLKELGYKDIYILPNEYIPKNTTNFIPYIFSKEQISKLFTIIDTYNFKSSYLKQHKMYSVLARLLYGSGLRISEALSLKVSNFDFTNSIIHIIESKNNCSRTVCMSQTLSNVMYNYIATRNISNDSLVFPSPTGKIYCQETVRDKFKNFFKIANIYTSSGKPPRIHDFRHTFAVHSLEKMVNNGMDIYCMLPFLSTFLGHKNIYATEKYLRLVEDNFTNLLMKNSKLIFPEVDEYEE